MVVESLNVEIKEFRCIRAVGRLLLRASRDVALPRENDNLNAKLGARRFNAGHTLCLRL